MYQLWYELYRHGDAPEDLTIHGVTINIHDVLPAIATLPTQSRRAVELLCLNDLPEPETSLILGYTHPHAMSSVKRLGLRNLKEMFESQEGV
jgi:DNA-directed RNA polymerase specialized sigma24 family protein